MNGYISFGGRDKREYCFFPRPFGETLPSEPGVYAITRASREDGAWHHEVLSVGCTENIAEVLKNHPCIECLDAHGANTICIRIEQSAPHCSSLACELIESLSPPCQPTEDEVIERW
ncbi:hypothetical protein Pan189_27850 [Stratiformator vulcanicus]|uniref:Uncharacterized protein n=2 Tax=Stratiformator vulcanicus TaxID=2527980 RepID=A0A517R3D4_9PLAN|nr:hypothetical protein Pan189_27850 [Stratiformator vulcanicus]